MSRALPRILLIIFFLIQAQAQAQAPLFDLAVRIGVTQSTIPLVSSDAILRKVVLDAAGNTYVTGYFAGTVQFGTMLTAPGNLSEIFVAKLDPAGNYLWAVQAGGAGNEVSMDLALDASGNAYITGSFTGATSTFGATTLTNGSAGNTPKSFVAKLDPAGNFLWAVCPSGAGGDEAHAIGLDAQGNAYITGSFIGNLTFGPNTLASLSRQSNWFVAKVNSAGTWLWGVRGGGTGTDAPLDLAVDASGNAYVTGYMHSRNASFGLFTLTQTGGGAAVVTKLNSAGTWLWAVLGGGNGPLEDAGNAIALDGQGKVYVTGVFQNNGAQFGSTALTNAGTSDLFVGQVDAATGNFRWAVRAGGTGVDSPGDLVADGQGVVYVTGAYQNAAAIFGATSLPYQGMYYDAFIAKLDVALGTWRWALRMGGTLNDVGHSLGLDQSNRLYVAGYYQSLSLALPPLSLPGSTFAAGSGFLARLGPEPRVQITGDSLLCGTAGTTLTATAPIAILACQWSTGATTPTIVVTQPGVYSVTATLIGGGTSTAQFRVRNFSPTARISGDSLLCAGNTTTLTANAVGPAPSYQWSTGATTASIQVTQPGPYSLTVRYGGTACTATAQHRLRLPSLRLSGDTLLCGQSAATTVTALAAGATALRWSTGAVTPSITVTQPGSYSVVATFANGCMRTASQRVTRPAVTISGDTVLCAGNATTLTAGFSGLAASYQWSTGATTASIRITQPGTYAVTVRNPACESTRQVRVRMEPALSNFTLGADTTLCTSQSLLLRAPAQVGSAAYRWSDGSTNATLLVTQPGVYTLRITTPCEEHMTNRRIDYQSCATIPNVITPNGDRLNDALVVKGVAGELSVFNRWGRQVYHATAYANEWGSEAAPGLYYYILRAKETVYKGWVEVIR
jgi:hypothetical protein